MKCTNCPFTLMCYTSSWHKGSGIPNDNRLGVYISHVCGHFVVGRWNLNKGEPLEARIFSGGVLRCERRTKRRIREALRESGMLIDPGPNPRNETIHTSRYCALCDLVNEEVGEASGSRIVNYDTRKAYTVP